MSFIFRKKLYSEMINIQKKYYDELTNINKYSEHKIKYFF